MAGWVPTDAAAWLRDRESIPGPWPEVLVVTDLRFWADPKACGGRARPSLRELGSVWGWSKSAVERFVSATERWEDPARRSEDDLGHQRDKAGTPAGQRRDTRRAPNADDAPELGHQRDSGGTLLGQQRDTPLGSRARTPHPTPHPTPLSSLRSESATATPPADQTSEPVPKWARSVTLPSGTSRRDLVEAVVSIRDAVVGKPGDQDSAGTASKSILGLWRALGCPDVGTFRDDVLLVVHAAKDCPERIFSRDIRAVDWPDGVDRSRDVETICRQNRWDARLAEARRWRDAGFPTSTAPARASPTPHRNGRESLGAKMRRLGLVRDNDEIDAEFTVEIA